MAKKCNNWTTKARQFFQRRIKSSDVVTGEEIRFKLLKRNKGTKTYLSKPSAPNVWGGFINGLVARGYLIDTGATRPMKSPASHGRRTPVYIVV